MRPTLRGVSTERKGRGRIAEGRYFEHDGRVWSWAKALCFPYGCGADDDDGDPIGLRLCRRRAGRQAGRWRRPTTQHHASGHEAEAAGGGQQNTEPAPPDDSSKGTGGGAAGGKVYQVGDAGEVELRVENGRPVLMEARPNAGWNANVTREGNELKVHFRRGEAEWEFEAEPEHGGIKVKSEPG